MGFLLIPLTILYDDYIYRPKLSEQKNPFVHIVPPAARRVGKNKYLKRDIKKQEILKEIV